MPRSFLRPGSTHIMTNRDQRGARHESPVDTATRILIVDHDRRVSASLAFMLTARGYDEVKAVRSAARALVLAESFRPAIVFLDIEMPEAASLDLAVQLRRRANQHSIRLIALTTTVEHGPREEARDAGFERYFVKPLTQVELDKVLRRPADAAV